MDQNGLSQDELTKFQRIQDQNRIESQLKNGTSWFYWIAGLTVLNSLIFIFNGSISFVVGLGFTQVVDGFLIAIREEIGPEAGILWQIAGFGFNFFVAAMFVMFGIFARKQILWVNILGIVLYTLDVLILLWVQDFFSILFHGLALFGLIKGYQAIKQLKDFEI